VPLTRYIRFADSVCVPRSVAITLVITVGTGNRGDTGCTKLGFSTVIRPPDGAAICCIWSKSQFVAAPMPRFGSVCDDNVCLVPNPTSMCIVFSIRSALIDFSISLVSGETGGPPCATPCAGPVASASHTAMPRRPASAAAASP